MKMLIWTVPAVSLLYAGCAPPATTGIPPYPQDLPSHMSEHFIAAGDLETAIIRGELDQGRAHARWLATHEPHVGLPGLQGPHLVAVRAAAARGADASSLEELAGASARMASACGGCHAATGGGLQYLPGPPPDSDESVSTRMARHVWAADRLWESLLDRSDDLWTAGTEALAASSISAREATWDPEVESRIEPVVQQLEAIARTGPGTRTWSDRAELVGELLTTCSTCHGAVGIDPLGRGIGDRE